MELTDYMKRLIGNNAEDNEIIKELFHALTGLTPDRVYEDNAKNDGSRLKIVYNNSDKIISIKKEMFSRIDFYMTWFYSRDLIDYKISVNNAKITVLLYLSAILY